MFIHKIRWFILFYIIGDLFTTIYAIEKGYAYEGNPAMSLLMSHSYLYLILIKLLFIPLLYVLFKYADSLQSVKLFNHKIPATKIFDYMLVVITFMGFLLTLNNSIVIIRQYYNIF